MDEVIQLSDDDDKMDTSIVSAENEASSEAVTASGKKRAKLDSSSSARSSSGSNLKLTAKIESAKKREEEKERERREKEEQRLKREAEAKRKREEEEALRKKRAEEARLKKEEERARKEEEERERKRKVEEARQKREEERARKEEEERERKRKAEEARIKREEEKARKEEEERERKRKLEELRLKREEEKEKLAQERYEKELKRLEAINAKNEERRRKEEEKQKEETLTVKTKMQFESYFIKKETPRSKDQEQAAGQSRSSRFMSFQLKGNMSLAPPIRRTDCFNMNDEQRAEFIAKLDRELRLGDEAAETAEPYKGLNYLDEIRKNPSLIRKQTNGCRKRKQSVSKGSVSCSSDEVKIIDVTSNVSKFKIKYLHFDPKVYRRPPYFGTWRKRSRLIGPKKPFAKDEKLIDYEIDSDDEWEDEADGESIADSEKGDQEQEELGDDEDDDGFFVPHGHLSDDELDEDERNLDPETKKAREDAKKEQYESERKKVSKYLVPKCFTLLNLKPDFLKPSELEDLKHLDRLRMVPIASVKLPVVIQTEEVLEKLAAQKLAEDAAQKAANKAAKQVAHLESLNGTSPSSTTKTPKYGLNKSKQPIQLISVSSTGAPSSPSPAPPANNTPSIINFISKMSNKKVVCRIEPIDQVLSSTSPAQFVPSATETAAKSAQSDANTPSSQTPKPATPGFRLDQDVKNRTPTVSALVASPKMTPTSDTLNTSCSTAEKRVKCLNNSSNEEEKSGKRLKLESEPEVIKAATNTPANAAIVINTLFRSASCKKSLKLSSSAKKLNENSAQKPKQPSDGTPNIKRAIVLGDSAVSSNSPVKMDVNEADAKEAVKVRSMQSLTGEPDKNKENGQAYVTLD